MVFRIENNAIPYLSRKVTHNNILESEVVNWEGTTKVVSWRS